MPITLIRNTKDNAMHGTDNDRYTGCRMKMQGASWYTREGELKDITDLTCDRCKEVFATKMIRESNKEELRIAKEEKKRYQKAKKQGMVREATYEEYMMNRESEASARRDSKDDAAISNSLHMLKNAIPAENNPGQPQYNAYTNNSAPQSQFNSYNNSAPVAAPQSPFDPYAQQTPVVSAPQSPFNPYTQSQPAVSAPQAAFNPYTQSQPAVSAPQASFDPYAQSQPAVSAPQASFNSYTQGQPAVSAPQAPFDPYAQSQSVVSAPQAPFDPYAYSQPVQNMFDPYAQSSQISDVQPQAGSIQLDSIETPVQQTVAPPVEETPAPSFHEYTGAASISAQPESPAASAAADDDFLSQFMINPAPSAVQETPAPAASSVSADSIVGATDDILSQFNIGSKIAEEPAPAVSPVPSASRADASSFFNDSIPVIGAEYAGASSVNSVVTEFGSLNITEEPKDDFVVPNVPVYQPGGNTYTTPGSRYSSPTSAFIEELAAPVSPVTSQPEVTNSFMSGTGSSFGSAEDLMSGFDEIPSVGSPVQSAPSMGGFDTVTPVQSAPSMGGFDTVTPVQSAPSMGGFDTVTPVQSAPSMGGFDTVAPVQPNTYGMPQSTYSQPGMYQQPASNPYAAPVQNSGFQMPQGYGVPVSQPVQQTPVQPQAQAPKPVQTPVFGEQRNGTADSIEDALRQLGAEVIGMGGNENQMPEKEEIMPDFVAYVSPSSRVLNNSSSAPQQVNTPPKRPVSAREAKQLAKIDAKFKKDLISRGFNPTEIKNGRRGK